MNNLNTYTITTLLLLGSIAGVNSPSNTNNSTETITYNNFPHEIVDGYKRKESINEQNDSFDYSFEAEDIIEFDNEQDNISIDVLQSASNVSILEDNPTSLIFDNILDNQFPEYHLKNYSTLSKYIKDEVSSSSEKINGHRDEFIALSNFVANRLAKLNFDKSAFELLPDNKVKFTFSFGNEKTVRITKNIIQEEPYNNQVFYSYFENKKPISANTNDLDAFVQGFNEYLLV